MPAGLEITDAVPGTSTGFCVVLLGFKVSLGKVKSESPGAFVSNSTPRNSYTKYDLNQNLRTVASISVSHFHVNQERFV